MTTPYMDEARLDAIRNQMTSNLASLNTALSGTSPAITGITAVSGMFYVGDPDRMPDATTNPFWVCVVGGGRGDQQDWESRLEFIAQNIFHHKVHTNIFVYIHPDTVYDADAFTMAEYRERLRSRICGWIRLVCFNNKTALRIPLASNEYGTGTDNLDNGYVREIYKGMSQKSFGDAVQVYSAHLVHVGEII